MIAENVVQAPAITMPPNGCSLNLERKILHFRIYLHSLEVSHANGKRLLNHKPYLPVGLVKMRCSLPKELGTTKWTIQNITECNIS